MSREKWRLFTKLPFYVLLPLTRRVTYLLDGNHRITAVYGSVFGAEKHIAAMAEAVKNRL